MSDENERQNKRLIDMENFRIITPILVTVVIFLLGIILNKVSDMDSKIFKHLTNDEIHCPKSMVVSKAEFSIYQELRQKQMDDIKDMYRQLIAEIDNHRKYSERK